MMGKSLIDVAMTMLMLGPYGSAFKDRHGYYADESNRPLPEPLEFYDSGKPLTKRQKRRLKGKKKG